MTKSKDYVDRIQCKLEDVANREQLLIRALGEALSVADRRLLDDVRSLTIEHETRRAMILSELQTLAARIGTFPAAAEPFEAIEHEVPDLPYEPDDAELEASAAETEEADAAGGDWRKALENIRSGAGLPSANLRKAG